MSTYQAEIPTAHASRYLQQLCKHWSHRFPVEFDASHGVVEMTGGRCTFDAQPNSLSLTLAGDEAAALPRLCDIVAEHLKRFAFREALNVQWREVDAPIVPPSQHALAGGGA
jgi:hypothetical protein